jgi:hypothetical protein
MSEIEQAQRQRGEEKLEERSPKGFHRLSPTIQDLIIFFLIGNAPTNNTRGYPNDQKF